MFSLHVRKQKRTNIYQVITHTKTKQVTGSKYYLDYLYYNRYRYNLYLGKFEQKNWTSETKL